MSKEAENFEHNRFLYVGDERLHFGCVNPFCGHGNPALPNHWEIPIETEAIRIALVSHDSRQVVFNVYIKKSFANHKAGDVETVKCADNLPACQEAFKALFHAV